MNVGDERSAAEGSVGGLRLAEEPQAGAEIEDDRIFAGNLERDVRGVAAVPAIGLAGARAGAPNTVESDLQRRTPTILFT
jgi:hypothetical protein